MKFAMVVRIVFIPLLLSLLVSCNLPNQAQKAAPVPTAQATTFQPVPGSLTPPPASPTLALPTTQPTTETPSATPLPLDSATPTLPFVVKPVQTMAINGNFTSLLPFLPQPNPKSPTPVAPTPKVSIVINPKALNINPKFPILINPKELLNNNPSQKAPSIPMPIQISSDDGAELGNLSAGGEDTYIFAGHSSQFLQILIFMQNSGEVSISVVSLKTGKVLAPASTNFIPTGQNQLKYYWWAGALTEDGNYLIHVKAGASTAKYIMDLTRAQTLGFDYGVLSQYPAGLTRINGNHHFYAIYLHKGDLFVLTVAPPDSNLAFQVYREEDQASFNESLNDAQFGPYESPSDGYYMFFFYPANNLQPDNGPYTLRIFVCAKADCPTL